jgi:hypothetical protein
MIGYVWVHLVAFVIWYSKLIGWVIEGREHAAAVGDQAFLNGGSWLGNCNACVREVLCIVP